MVVYFTFGIKGAAAIKEMQRQTIAGESKHFFHQIELTSPLYQLHQASVQPYPSYFLTLPLSSSYLAKRSHPLYQVYYNYNQHSMITLEQVAQLKKEADLYRESFYVYTHWKEQVQTDADKSNTKKSMIKIEEKFKKVKKEEQIARQEKAAKQEELPKQKKRQPRHKKIKKQQK